MPWGTYKVSTTLLKRQKIMVRCFERMYAKPEVKSSSKEFAINHFDQFYGSVFNNWTSIRLGLLCPHHYCAVTNSFSKQDNTFFEELGTFNMRTAYNQKLQELEQLADQSSDKTADIDGYNFSSTNKIYNTFVSGTNSEECINADEYSFVPSTQLRNRDDVIDEELIAKYYKTVNNPHAQFENGEVIRFPEFLNVYMFPRGKFKEFPTPVPDPTGIINYYLMDGASILPVLALDIKENEDIGDFCASPGGKSLAILFSLKFGKLICNDANYSRMRKLKTVLSSYVPSGNEWNEKILVSKIDVSQWQEYETFDKILLDVPCTNDRLSVTREGNSIFKQDRNQERILLPKTQTDMLCSALQALKPGGSLVYSTCSLSPLQNDGVVHIALSQLQMETSMEFVVLDLRKAFRPFEDMFKFSHNCHYGQLVIPFLPLNYGPMYISKIKRKK